MDNAPPIAAKGRSIASVLNGPTCSSYTQIEIYFSIVQRKVLTPNDFPSLNELEQRLLAFQRRYEETAEPSLAKIWLPC
jgi:hypothetical protein